MSERKDFSERPEGMPPVIFFVILRIFPVLCFIAAALVMIFWVLR